MSMARQTAATLTWIGKDARAAVEPAALREDAALSYRACARDGAEEGDVDGGGVDDRPDNRLIQGDNLPALRALEPEFAGRIRCVYIDPPYNSGGAFAHYDDGMEHAAWLSAMRERAELLRRLLRDDGVLFVSIGDDEQAYLKVLLDELFGRANFCGQFVWERKRKPSFLDAQIGTVTEYVLCYAKERACAPPFVGGTTTAGKRYPLNNVGNGVRDLRFPAGGVRFECPDGVVEPGDMSTGHVVARLLDRVVIAGGRNRDAFRLRGEWRYSQRRLDELLAAGEEIVVHRAPFRPNHVKPGGEPKKLKNLLSVAHYGMPTYEDATAESRALFGADAFDYPKPERLIATLVAAVTAPGDWVLDAFAGSGTTGAVAHKLGRRWIMIELGAHAATHAAPRLRRVVDGTDPGGITGETGWRGGGGFRFYRVASR